MEVKLNATEAAALFGVSEQRITQFCRDGRIVSKSTGEPAVLMGRRPEWVIPDDPRILTAREWKARRKAQEE